MGLYLCVVGEDDDEIDGIEVGLSSDFQDFRNVVAELAASPSRKGVLRRAVKTPYPVLMNHSAVDGEWSVREASDLLLELSAIRSEFDTQPPRPFADASWQRRVAEEFDITPTNLSDSFIDVNGERLLDGLARLAELSLEHGRPILFQ